MTTERKAADIVPAKVNAATIRFEVDDGKDHRKAFRDLCPEWLFDASNYTSKKKRADYVDQITVLLPDDVRVTWASRYEHGVIDKAGPDDEIPRCPLTHQDWLALRLALDGVADDSKDAESVRERGEQERDDWLWKGLIPDGGVTLLAGPPKAGKSTLLRGLLKAGAVDPGEAARTLFLGLPVRKFSALVVSEESHGEWSGAPDNMRVMFHRGGPIGMEAWDQYVDDVRKIACVHGSGLLVIDSFAAICGVDENSSQDVSRAMAPILHLSREWGLAVLLIHHTTKSGTGSSSVRGSSAFNSNADSILRLELVGEDEDDPRRLLRCVNRRGPTMKTSYTMQADGSLVLPGVPKKERRGLRKDRGRGDEA